MQATGTFEVRVTPADVTDTGKAGGLGRMSVDKVWSGDIEGTSKAEMLTGITPETGSMAYVAIERITATVGGRSGSFFLAHKATMMKGDPSTAVLDATVVPNSGIGALQGITGTLGIDQSTGVHRYTFDYQLADA